MAAYCGNLDRDLGIVAKQRLAEQITGGLSNPSKMPELAWGLSAARCKLGNVLAQEEGTVCHACYARKGRYNLGQVKRSLVQRFDGLEHPLWVPAMVLLIRWYVGRHFRWFDSGDLQSVEHLRAIADIARHTPEILHWLPTQEHDLVRQFDGSIPDNLTIRLSAHQLDGSLPEDWPHTSVVYTDRAPEGVLRCPALDQGNYCGACRACWDRDVGAVAYRKH